MFSVSKPLLPKSENELLQRAATLTGHTLGELANQLQLSQKPINLKRHKGWIGTLLELYLGASAGSHAEPDFPQLGIELKTIPVDNNNLPLETTFVCLAPLVDNSGIIWETSHVRHKLQRVLWIPIEASRTIDLLHRRISKPILWSPTEQQEYQLRTDWEELMDMIVLGQVQKITAHYGTVLQLRPKAANSRILTKAIGEFGQPVLVNPLGFYLKKGFTTEIIKNNLSCN